MENAAYPQSQCAEASAIGALVAAGEREIAEVAVVAERMDVCPPCGGCRQRLAEFAGPDTPVYLGGSHVTTTGELLPLVLRPWTPSELARGRRRPARARRRAPRVGVVLGSGLGAVADAVRGRHRDPLRGPARLPRPTVEGHAGPRGGRPASAACRSSALQGRAHLYEGGDLDELRVPVRALRRPAPRSSC